MMSAWGWPEAVTTVGCVWAIAALIIFAIRSTRK